ncbi:hypothetical protein EV199_0830 [Pseudobacter ginsenosidimutans]|uniref:Uncharacterized protein n=2 Tax=Pseudobacter ginsenosidimutans TaxID=661488 RepID=A0A4Q7N3E0_9BACT|nr:hypothetical protein EV199_0830 [Pseudobacter ginsenosidimutans]
MLGSMAIAGAQVNYRAGFAQTSLEPPSYPFSLSLAGYGAPRDGRFTLEWIRKGEAVDCTAFGNSANNLIAVSQGKLMISGIDGEPAWKSIGNADGIRLLAGNKAGWYAADQAGNLLYAVPAKKLKWKKIGNAANTVSLTVSDSCIYIATNDGAISYASLGKKALQWSTLTTIPHLQGLAAYKGSLYALTTENDLIKYDLGKEHSIGTRIARYNGLSYDVKLKAIAIAGNTIYGIDSSNTIYTGRHRTDGDLSVSALAVAAGKQIVVLAGTDVCGFDGSFISSVKQEILRKNKIPPAAILVNASHTHFAPVTQNWLTWGEHNQKPDSVYLYGVVRHALIAAIQAALRHMEPSKIYFGRGKTAIGGNRTFTKAPLPYDDDLDVIKIVREKDKERTVLFLAGCHPVFKNEGAEGITISANYPGVTRKWLAENAGIRKSLFIQGCGGDINPMDLSHTATGTKLAEDITAVLDRPLEELNGNISFYLDSINFPVKNRTEEELVEFRKRNAGKEGDVYAEKNVRWANLMLQLNREHAMPSSMPVYIQTINIGPWKLVGLSREAVTDYSIGIKKIWPGERVSVAGYCNDVSSYLPTQRHIREGVYEGMDSFFWYGQPAIFPESVYDDILEKIKQQHR